MLPHRSSLLLPSGSAPRSPDRALCAKSRSHSDRIWHRRALTLVEVMFASGILSMVMLGVLQGMLQSRRQTEGSIRQATCASLVQGYMEQIKSMKYATTLNALPISPSITPGSGSELDWKNYVGTAGVDESNPTLTLKDSYQKPTDPVICLAAGLAPTTLPDASTLPTNASRHTESVDIDNLASTLDNCTLEMWVWINPITGTNVANCRAIVIVYRYTVVDGGRTRYYTEMARQIRSIIPTDG
jgi:type II secretory pathway pseudopilin PulG